MRAAATDEGLRAPEDAPTDSGGSGNSIVVCIEAAARHGESLLAYGATLARGLGRRWYGLRVDTGEVPSGASRERSGEWVRSFRERVSELGGTPFTYRADDPVETMLRFAREQDADTLIVERPPRRAWWHRWLSADDPVSRLIREARGMAVVVADLGSRLAPAGEAPTMSGSDGRPSPRAKPPTLAELLRAGAVGIFDSPMGENQVVDRLIDRLDDRYPALHLDRLKPLLVQDAKRHRLKWQEDVVLLHAGLAELERSLTALGIVRLSLDPGRPAAVLVMILLTPEGQPEAAERARRLCLGLLDDREARTRLQARVTADSVLDLVEALETSPDATE